MRLARHGALVAVAMLLAGCSPPGAPLDLLHAAGQRLQEASVTGRNLEWVRGQAGKTLRLNDLVVRTLPAGPPSRLRFAVDIPERARLTFYCGIPPRHHDEPGVEFVVKLSQRGRERILWSQVMDPVNRPEHRSWVFASVDLQRFAGSRREIVLESRGFESAEDPRRAFWGAPAVVADATEAPLVLLYLVDTLRADHTTPYGYERDTTPALMSLSRDGVVFDAAIAHASWTKPSVASIFTSLLPGRHRAVQLRDRLDEGLVTLAEFLSTRGYVTGAAIANSVIYAEGSHFEQGFDLFAGLHGEDDRPSKLVDADRVVDAAIQWLDARRGLPTFLYVHTMDPHVPYAPPPPFDRKFEPPPAPGRSAADPRYDYVEPRDRDRLMAQYDGAVAYGDQEFGRLMEALKARGLYDRAMVLFTADHGEEFLDHGQWLHGRSVFDELVHVPLIVKFPGGRAAGTRVKQQVQSVDILPTILENEGLPVPPSPVVAGQPLQRVLAGEAPEPPVVVEISHRGIVAHGMRTNRDKYVRSFSPEDAEMYFDLLQDPKERLNRLQEAPERVRHLKAGTEAAMVPNAFRHALRFTGTGEYEVSLKTSGWLEGVEVRGLGRDEEYAVTASGRRLLLRLRPRPGQPREVAFSLRPMGVPIRLEGKRNGRPLRPTDILIAAEAIHPPEVPFLLPDVESEAERVTNIFASPPPDRPGIQIWLTLGQGRRVMEFDDATRERLKALGYLGN